MRTTQSLSSVSVAVATLVPVLAFAQQAPAPPPAPGQTYPPPQYPPAQPTYPSQGGYPQQGPYQNPPAGYYAPQQQAYAPPPPQSMPGYHEHDGVFLRLTFGPSYTTMNSELEGSEATVSGFGPQFGIALGGAIAPNFIIFGEVLANSAIDPTLEADGQEFSGSGSASVLGIGPGAAFYFSGNAYLSATLAFSQISVSDADGNEVGESDFGIGGNLLLGNEWWVAPNWGVGAAAQIFLARMKDKNDGGFVEVPTWTTLGIGILLSASYN